MTRPLVVYPPFSDLNSVNVTILRSTLKDLGNNTDIILQMALKVKMVRGVPFMFLVLITVVSIEYLISVRYIQLKL